MQLPTHRPVKPFRLGHFLKSIETRKIKNGHSEVIHFIDADLVAAVPDLKCNVDYFILEIKWPEHLTQPYMIVKREPGRTLVFRYLRTLVGCEAHLYKITQ